MVRVCVIGDSAEDGGSGGGDGIKDGHRLRAALSAPRAFRGGRM